ncbi:hypothetical protein H2509_06100 [Stappia sp. F7233]|uniref:Uncharacterized protein n=1 Tax=Stappia albiluteola TaxID=2758565 RepID=A0A839ACV7_9HYPH|nr:hypothetical protein [Stappia albiluteola]MBA5776697.1 hypothetical protein [Stappia albiluteola]
MTSRVSLTSFSLALACGLALAAPASAFETTGNATADHFLTTIEAGGATVTSIGTVSDVGGVISIDAITADVAADGKVSKLEIGEARLEGAEVLESKRLTVADFRLNDISVTAEDGGVTVDSLHTVGTVFPSPEEVGKAGKDNAVAPLYKSAELLGIMLKAEGRGAVPIERVAATVDALDGDTPTAGSFQIEGIRLSKADLDEEGQKMLTDLGYEDMTLSVEGTGKWLPDEGILNLEKLAIAGKEVGNLAFAARINGVTREVVARLEQAQGDPEKALGLLQGLGVEHLAIDLENSSIVERVLDRQAQEVGTDRATFVEQITGALPLMLSVIGNPEFQNKVAGALTTFLKDPKSLRAVATPANPVPIAQLIGTAMIAPQTLPDVLAVEIRANSE